MPEKPNLHEVEILAIDQMRLRWDPPHQSNGPIDHYLIKYRPSNSTMKWAVRKTKAGKLDVVIHTKCEIEGDGVMYDVLVSAVNRGKGHMIYGPPVKIEHEMCHRAPGRNSYY